MCLKGLFIFCLLWGFSLTTFAQTRLPQGEIVEVRIVDGFTSKDAPQKIKGVIDMDVKDPDTGKILIRRGAPVRIDTKIEKPRGKGRPGKITLNLLSTESVDGKNIRLSRTAEFSGKSRRGLALGLGIGLPLKVCMPKFLPVRFSITSSWPKIIQSLPDSKKPYPHNFLARPKSPGFFMRKENKQKQ